MALASGILSHFSVFKGDNRKGSRKLLSLLINSTLSGAGGDMRTFVANIQNRANTYEGVKGKPGWCDDVLRVELLLEGVDDPRYDGTKDLVDSWTRDRYTFKEVSLVLIHKGDDLKGAEAAAALKVTTALKASVAPGARPPCSICGREHKGICFTLNPDAAPLWWKQQQERLHSKSKGIHNKELASSRYLLPTDSLFLTNNLCSSVGGCDDIDYVRHELRCTHVRGDMRVESHEWVVDSGASDNFCGTSVLLRNISATNSVVYKN
jgi:hypothetical protein